MKCVICGVTFPLKQKVRKHYEIDHQIQFAYESSSFESFDEFTKWKNDLQRETICQFVRRHTKHNKAEEVIHFVCHRSGYYKTKEENRQRKLKSGGSKRIGGYCPAEIVVKCSRADGTCAIEYQKVHVGHQIGTETEIKHMYIEKEEKMVMAATVRKDCTTRYNILAVDDINNAIKNFETDENARAFGNDPEYINTVVMENLDSILYFKDVSDEDEKYELLEKNDFMIVMMNDPQEKNLRRYGGKAIAFDSTHGKNPDGFFLHSLLVVDVDFEGLPVAFALTNRNDHRGVSVFLQCIRDRVGVIKPVTSVSEMQPTFINCWNEIMQPAERHLYCMLHVFDSWKSNLKKIPNAEKRKEIKELVYGLAHEMDTTVFKEKLQSFMSNQDEDSADFVTYFRTYFGSCPNKWAYSYRRDTEMNINMHLERYHRALKENVSKDKKIKDVFSCLRFILEYLMVKEKNSQSKHVRGKINAKLRALFTRHKMAQEELFKTNSITIQPANSQSWYIGSFKDIENLVLEMHIVSKRDELECALYDDISCNLACTLCKICFHQYRCTCPDSSAYNNMCRHIHMLGMYLLQASNNVYLDEEGVDVEANVNTYDGSLLNYGDKIASNIHMLSVVTGDNAITINTSDNISDNNIDTSDNNVNIEACDSNINIDTYDNIIIDTGDNNIIIDSSDNNIIIDTSENLTIDESANVEVLTETKCSEMEIKCSEMEVSGSEMQVTASETQIDLEKAKQEARNVFENSLLYAENAEQVRELTKSYLNSIEPLLKSVNIKVSEE